MRDIFSNYWNKEQLRQKTEGPKTYNNRARFVQVPQFDVKFFLIFKKTVIFVSEILIM